MGTACYTVGKEAGELQGAQIQLHRNQQNGQFYRSSKQNQTNMRKNPENNEQYQKSLSKSKWFNHDKGLIQLNSQSQFRKAIDKQLQRCTYFYKEHYIDAAAQSEQEIHALVQSAAKKNINVVLKQDQKSFLNIVKMEYTDVLFYENQIQKGGWDLKSDKNGIKISCRREPDHTVGCRIQAFCDVPFQVLISVMIQMDYYNEYTPFLQVSREEKEVARNCRIGYTLNHIPFFTKRQSYFQGVGYSRLNHKSKELFLFTRSIHDKKHLQEILQFPVTINQEYIQLDYKYFVVRYRPIKENVGYIDIGMNIDAKIKYIPTWLMEKVAKDFGQNFFKNIIKISKNFKGSKWQKNVEKNPDLFLYFQNEMKTYFEKNKTN